MPTTYLFVNKTSSSSSLSHSARAEKSSIFAQAQKSKSTLSKQSSLDQSAASSGTGPKQTSAKKSLIRGLHSHEEISEFLRAIHDHLPTYETSLVFHHALHSVYPRGNSADPFDAGSLRITNSIQALIRYYLNNFAPTTKFVEVALLSVKQQELETRQSAIEHVRNCLGEKTEFLTLLAAMASRIEYTDGVDMGNITAALLANAMASMRNRLDTHSATDFAHLRSVYFLMSAEWYRFNYPAWSIHFEALKKFVDEAGGLKSLPSGLKWTIIRADSISAAETLQRPYFPCDFDPGPLSEFNFVVHPMLQAALSCDATGSALIEFEEELNIREPLRSIIVELTQCTKILRFLGKAPSVSATMTEWISQRQDAVRHQLLDHALSDKRSEVLRVTLIMWHLMVSTAVGYQRSIKIMALKLQKLLCGVENAAWRGLWPVLLWILIIGATSSFPKSPSEGWFINEIVGVASDDHEALLTAGILTEETLTRFCETFFHIEAVQQPLIRRVVHRLVNDMHHRQTNS